MQLRPLVLLTLFSFLVACSSEAPKPAAPQPTPAQEKKVPGIEDLGPLPAYQREISGSLTNIPAGAEVEMALLVIDAQTWEAVKRLPMRKPIGKYNLWNKLQRSEGTSH